MIINPRFPSARSTSVVVAFVLLLDAIVTGHAGRLSLCVLAATLIIGVAIELWGHPKKVKPEQYPFVR